jgi:hypothetical protein
MGRYVGRHRKSAEPEQQDGDTLTLPGMAELSGEGTVTLVAVEQTRVLTEDYGPTRVLPASTWADPPARPRGPGGKFIKAGPDEQDDKEDQDPQPGDPIRQVPGEKDTDPRVN